MRAATSTACAGDPGRDGVDAGLLGLLHDVVHLLELGGGFAERHGPRHVGVIAAVQRAEIQLDDVAFVEQAVSGLVVRLGGVLAEGHDRLEAEAVGAVTMQQVLELTGHGQLGHADREGLEDVLERLVGDRLGPAKVLELLVVLHPPQPFDLVTQRHELHAGELGRELFVRPHGDLMRLEAQPLDAHGRQLRSERLAEPAEVGDALEVGHLVA